MSETKIIKICKKCGSETKPKKTIKPKTCRDCQKIYHTRRHRCDECADKRIKKSAKERRERFFSNEENKKKYKLKNKNRDRREYMRNRYHEVIKKKDGRIRRKYTRTLDISNEI